MEVEDGVHLRRPVLERFCGSWLESSPFSLASVGGVDDELAGARGVSPPMVVQSEQIPASMLDGYCGTSTQLVCYRVPVGFGCAATSRSSFLAAFRRRWRSTATSGVVAGSEDLQLQGLRCNFLVLQVSFRPFSRTAGLRVGSRVWVRVWVLYLCLILTRTPFLKKKLLSRLLAG